MGRRGEVIQKQTVRMPRLRLALQKAVPKFLERMKKSVCAYLSSVYTQCPIPQISFIFNNFLYFF